MKMITFLFVIIFLVCLRELSAQCPKIGEVLNQGYGRDASTHCTGSGSHNEFGVVDSDPFIIKVNDYPPVKSFPKSGASPECLGIDYFYIAYRTYPYLLGDPIPYNLTWHQYHVVRTYR